MVQDECTEITHRKRAQKAHRIPPKEKTLKKVTLYQPQRPSAALLKTNGNPRRKGPAPPRSTILPATLLRTLHLVSFRHRSFIANLARVFLEELRKVSPFQCGPRGTGGR
jgi:hypothetical protein